MTDAEFRCEVCGNVARSEYDLPSCAAVSYCHNEVVKIEAERDRYRAALKKITTLEMGYSFQAIGIATQALEAHVSDEERQEGK